MNMYTSENHNFKGCIKIKVKLLTCLTPVQTLNFVENRLKSSYVPPLNIHNIILWVALSTVKPHFHNIHSRLKPSNEPTRTTQASLKIRRHLNASKSITNHTKLCQTRSDSKSLPCLFASWQRESYPYRHSLLSKLDVSSDETAKCTRKLTSLL